MKRMAREARTMVDFMVRAKRIDIRYGRSSRFEILVMGVEGEERRPTRGVYIDRSGGSIHV